jgi:FKBP-type peptidyl-prolyl cis-trans isomerase 2
VEVRDRLVVVDTNHPRAGQALEPEVELLAIQAPEACAELQPLQPGDTAEKAPRGEADDFLR